MIAIDQQIVFIQRELLARTTQNTHLISTGKMRHDVAMRGIESMRAVLQTLLRVQAGEKFRETGK